ncbi:tripartite tricarboxylate transporter TctB family protein [Uliginosibacterium sp. sgz301328]|uniref:tripartite tricarboxylate transporter TctB family protein n=1 Tax=Uliginosibacterium sp. sgz301328 TaxID=3243764 RepID=UPI00359D7933
MTEGLGWMVLGIAILIGSLLMDRLEEQDINPYTIPGLLPALLGIAMTALGFLVFIRKWTRFKGVVAARAPLSVDKRTAMNRMLLVLGICVIFCAGLLGRGLPYWLTGGVFVTACILLLDNRRRAAGEGRFTSGKIVRAAVIGFVASIAITLVFEQIFMIRLP